MLELAFRFRASIEVIVRMFPVIPKGYALLCYRSRAGDCQFPRVRARLLDVLGFAALEARV